MLLRIDDSVRDFAISSDASQAAVRAAAENLTIAHRKGLHLIIGSPEIFRWLHDHLKCGEETRASLLRLYSESVQNAEINNLFDIYINITGNQSAEGKFRSPPSQVRLNLHIERFTNWETCKEGIFIAENLSDIELGSFWGRAYAHKHGVYGKQLKFEDKPGGGSTAAQILEVIQYRNERLCLCMVDSDKHHPADQYGTTADDVLAAWSTSNFFCEVLVLENDHEAENLIDPERLLEIYQSDHVKKASSEILIKIKCTDPEIKRYLDMKRGLTLSDIFQMPHASPIRAYWDSKLPQLLACGEITQPCECLHTLTCSKENNCQCVIFSPLGTKVLNDFVRSMRDFSDAKLYRHLTRESSTDFLWIGRRIYEYFCCSPGFSL